MGNTKSVIFFTIAITSIGAAAVAWAAWESKELTGEWLGYPIPDPAAYVGAIGLLVTILGLLAFIGTLVLIVAERSGIRAALQTAILDDDHPIARIGRGILSVDRIWSLFRAVFLVGMVVVAAIFDPLVAIILTVTVCTMVAIWVVWKRQKSGPK